MGSRKKILVVDDDFSSRRLLERIIRSHFKYEVLQAQDGSEALQTMFKELPDLVLLDMQMPVVNGLEVLETMSKNSTLSSIPVIACTGLKNDKLVKQVISYGVKSYVVKPIESAAIIEKIAAIFESEGIANG